MRTENAGAGACFFAESGLVCFYCSESSPTELLWKQLGRLIVISIISFLFFPWWMSQNVWQYGLNQALCLLGKLATSNASVASISPQVSLVSLSANRIVTRSMHIILCWLISVCEVVCYALRHTVPKRDLFNIADRVLSLVNIFCVKKSTMNIFSES